jgi:hypothetical protein
MKLLNSEALVLSHLSKVTLVFSLVLATSFSSTGNPNQQNRGIVFPVSIEWQTRSGVKHYRLQIAEDDKFQNVFFDRRVSGTRYLVTELSPAYYYWRVAGADSGVGSFSTPVRFFVSGGVVTTTQPAPRAPGRRWRAASSQRLVKKGLD